MSIIATVYLKEGIIMATDSRLTRTITKTDGTKERYPLTDYAQKLFTIKNSKIGISICVNAELDGKTYADFIRDFELNQIGENDSVTEIANKLKDYVQGKYRSDIIFHVCGYLNDKRHVYRIINDTIFVVLNENNEECCCASWNGEPQVLANLFTGDNALIMDWKFMELKDGIDFAEFMIDATCKIHRFQKGLGTCGGPIDVLLIAKDYSKWIRHKVFNP